MTHETVGEVWEKFMVVQSITFKTQAPLICLIFLNMWENNAILKVSLSYTLFSEQLMWKLPVGICQETINKMKDKALKKRSL